MMVRKRQYLLIGLVLAILVLGALGVMYERSQEVFPEVEELARGERTFQEYSDYFRDLSDKKGAVYAYDVLLRASLAPGIDLHLLGHVIGDMLYKQQGVKAMHSCTQEFRNACSHSVVIGILLEHGEGSLGEIAATCKDAPGGEGSYTMCFHGLGHGVLAYNGYRLDDAVAMCKRVGTTEFADQEYGQCVGGAVMEMIAGVHDREVWQSQYNRYFTATDPLKLCTSDYMDPSVRTYCYMQLTPYLFQVAGINLDTPDPNLFGKAFSLCEAVPMTAQRERDACYRGFGKEFVVMARNHDVRRVNETDEAALRTVRSWCALAGDSDGEVQCNASALDSLYWGGEIPPDAAFRFCAIATGAEQTACYQKLTNLITYYLPQGLKRKGVCERLPEEYQNLCNAV